MPKKYTYVFIKSCFESNGYTLLTKEYTNSKTKLNYRCPEGHEHSIIWNNFQQGQRCPQCVNNNIKHNYVFIKEQFEKEGYTLLSTEYKNAHTKLKYVCNKGHFGSIAWNSFRYGIRCFSCGIENRSGKESGLWKGGVAINDLPLYGTYASQLEKYQSVYKIEQNGLELLGIECIFCKKIFVPKTKAVQGRVAAINGKTGRASNLYCSEECKDNCPVFRQVLWPKDYKPYENIRPDQKQWAALVKERDHYTCQKCGVKTKVMFAHHIDPINNNPIESLDTNNGITLCKKCHKENHSTIGCTYYDLRCRN